MSDRILENQSEDTENLATNSDDIPDELAYKIIADALEDSDVGIGEKEKVILATSITAHMVSQFSGPLPHPSTLKGYEEVLTGAAERILAMAEDEQRHRHIMEDKFFETDRRDSLLGVIFAFVLGLTPILLGAFIVIWTKNVSGAWAGGLMGVSGLSAIVVHIIRGTRVSWKNKDADKDKND